MAWYSLIECPAVSFSVRVLTDAHTGTILNDYGVPVDTEPDSLHVTDKDDELIPSVSVFPNPFNPVTTISFSLPQTSHVSLAVYSVSGQKVATLVAGFMPAGTHAVVFDGSSLSSGLYLYRFEAKGFAKTGKIVLVK